MNVQSRPWAKLPLGLSSAAQSRLRLARFGAYYFFDTEFYQHGKKPDQTVDLISLGVVCEDGRTLHLVSGEFDEKALPWWLKKNVIRHIWGEKRFSAAEIARQLEAFVGDDPAPRFVGRDAKTDWQLLCRLFAGKLPERFPRTFIDIDHLWRELQKPALPPHPGKQHHALADAQWTRIIWDFLNALKQTSETSEETVE